MKDAAADGEALTMMANAELSPGFKHAERVLTAVHSSRAAVSAVAASWCRSALHHGLDPSAPQASAERLGDNELNTLRASNGELLTVAAPVLDRLHGSVGLAGACVIIADAGGVVLDWRTTDSDAALFEDIGLTPGVSWAEAAQGTNGIGTCLVEGCAVTIHRDEHFASRNVGVSCMDAPIFDPDGRLIAALDISSARGDHDRTMAALIGALVQDAARSIERDLFCRRYSDARIVLAGAGDQAMRGNVLLAVDRDDLVIGATRAARQQFRLATGADIEPRPLGDFLGQTGPASFDDGERAVLRQALARAGGNVSSAARLLGIGRATFYRRMERVGLSLRH
ncbi:GAF domain-containing protein [Novosphingobium pituita]|uniref:Helix-turn-helix domain-containing protein n=1 Tax=Novosphingobium pituita TaxID=3056842 RepID=A0ABQ6PAC6_9SPHN|nr:GAF domain-containing protein [Novosphingobium sp. IK01]GMM62184.1 helix-turn-helix domain-containing protein [Novosphingobium sp. IK01]